MKSTKTRVSVSIVIPVYNEERHLRACLQAIAEQTVMPLEVIVVDNNSSDQTVAIAGSFPFVRLVSETTQGIVYARNAGFNAARGDIIARIDADIHIPPHWTSNLTAYYDEVTHLHTAWSGQGYFYNIRMSRFISWSYALLAFRFNKLLLGHFTLWGSNMALPRALWLHVRDHVCLRSDIHEDLDLAMHLYQAGFAIVYDAHLKTSAELKRVQSNRGALWDYLGLWPRTLRVHKKSQWLLCWMVGVGLLYPAAYVVACIDRLARSVKSS